MGSFVSGSIGGIRRRARSQDEKNIFAATSGPMILARAREVDHLTGCGSGLHHHCWDLREGRSCGRRGRIAPTAYFMETELAASHDLPVNSRTKPASRPVLYISLIIGVVLVAYAYKLRTEGIFACLADGYSSDRYLAYCQANGYADYEHGAFWLGLEPTTRESVAKADVLFLGTSRMQIAFSTAATSRWFASDPVRYFLMGFGYSGNVVFEGALLRKFNAHPKVYVINVDQFFDRRESPPVQTVMRDSSGRNHYQVKHLWQIAHEAICERVAVACGSRYTIFRSRETGAYYLRGLGEFRGRPVSYDETIDRINAEKEASIGGPFLAGLPVKADCVILTLVPTEGTKLGTANALASALGLPLVTPQLADLQTFDGSHLDRPSAERWSDAFFKAAGPQIRRCIKND
jgi:hypothetical protein